MTKLVTNKVRFSYVSIFNTKEDLQGNQKYSIQVIIPKSDTAGVKLIQDAIQSAVVEAKKKGKLPEKVSGLKSPLRDGDEYNKTREEEGNPTREELKDSYYMNFSNTKKPQIIDLNGNQIDDESEVYSGCYGRVSVTLFGYSANGNKGISGYLQHVLKTEEGEPLGGGVGSANSDFGILPSLVRKQEPDPFL
jgi:hypothetical protein